MLVESFGVGLVASLCLCPGAAATSPASDRQKPLATVTIGSENPFNDDLRKLIGNIMERWKIPGMSVAVVDGDNVYTEVSTAPRRVSPLHGDADTDRDTVMPHFPT